VTSIPKITVILCTHAPQKRNFTRCLESLKAQTLPKADWQFLVVDNASPDPVARNFDFSWHPNSRVLEEKNLGLINARCTGIKSATADLLLFVDDDNVLAPSYLETGLTIARQYPFLGAWGPKVELEFEKQPPVWAAPYLHPFGLGQGRSLKWTNIPFNDVPMGAGLWVRAVVAEGFRGTCETSSLRQFLGRKGSGFSAGEDEDLVMHSVKCGLGWGMFPQLTLTHLITANRVEESYLLKLYEGVCYSGTILRYAWGVLAPTESRNWRQTLSRLIPIGENPISRRFKKAGDAGRARAEKELAEHAQSHPETVTNSRLAA